MPNITVKGLPVSLHRQLKARAARNRRSLNSEIIVCLQSVIAPPPNDRDDILERARRLREKLPIEFNEEDFNRYKREGRL